ncbi:MAG TPA: endonuclease/exonuclease/phosphatase family protein [Candidatus Lokiarchaeia archaeon]|nr:endonuclease/exonuclease/phosphatase family protein [Candidatus Lokiarchaeia archaeon]
MVTGIFLSANVGNTHPLKGGYLFGLADPAQGRLIHQKILEIDPDICVIQELWNFMAEVLGDQYEALGYNHCIAVNPAFGHIVPGSFRSHAISFKQSPKGPVLPPRNDPGAIEEQLRRLQRQPYDGTPESPYGIPADFDVTSAIIETTGGTRILVACVHVMSAPWNDATRAKELREWLLEDCLTRAQQECEGRVLIGGDFNDDELRRPKAQTAEVTRQLLAVPGMHDAAINDREITTNYPRILGNYRYDHLLGTAEFSDYKVQQSLTDSDFQQLKNEHRLTWWLYIDHRNVSARFEF